jgi:hypothetical protein
MGNANVDVPGLTRKLAREYRRWRSETDASAVVAALSTPPPSLIRLVGDAVQLESARIIEGVVERGEQTARDLLALHLAVLARTGITPTSIDEAFSVPGLLSSLSSLGEDGVARVRRHLMKQWPHRSALTLPTGDELATALERAIAPAEEMLALGKAFEGYAGTVTATMRSIEEGAKRTRDMVAPVIRDAATHAAAAPHAAARVQELVAELLSGTRSSQELKNLATAVTQLCSGTALSGAAGSLSKLVADLGGDLLGPLRDQIAKLTNPADLLRSLIPEGLQDLHKAFGAIAGGGLDDILSLGGSLFATSFPFGAIASGVLSLFGGSRDKEIVRKLDRLLDATENIQKGIEQIQATQNRIWGVVNDIQAQVGKIQETLDKNHKEVVALLNEVLKLLLAAHAWQVKTPLRAAISMLETFPKDRSYASLYAYLDDELDTFRDAAKVHTELTQPEVSKLFELLEVPTGSTGNSKVDEAHKLVLALREARRDWQRLANGVLGDRPPGSALRTLRRSCARAADCRAAFDEAIGANDTADESGEFVWRNLHTPISTTTVVQIADFLSLTHGLYALTKDGLARRRSYEEVLADGDSSRGHDDLVRILDVIDLALAQARRPVSFLLPALAGAVLPDDFGAPTGFAELRGLALSLLRVDPTTCENWSRYAAWACMQHKQIDPFAYEIMRTEHAVDPDGKPAGFIVGKFPVALLVWSTEAACWAWKLDDLKPIPLPTVGVMLSKELVVPEEVRQLERARSKVLEALAEYALPKRLSEADRLQLAAVAIGSASSAG